MTPYPGPHDDCIATVPHNHDRPYKRGDWSPSQESEMRQTEWTAEDGRRNVERETGRPVSAESPYEPRTAAGKSLIAGMPTSMEWDDPTFIAYVARRILAIEEQAATEARRELLAKVWREFGADAHTIARIERLLEEPR